MAVCVIIGDFSSPFIQYKSLLSCPNADLSNCFLDFQLKYNGCCKPYLPTVITGTHTHNRFTALWNLSGKTRVSRYQKNIHPLLSS